MLVTLGSCAPEFCSQLPTISDSAPPCGRPVAHHPHRLALASAHGLEGADNGIVVEISSRGKARGKALYLALNNGEADEGQPVRRAPVRQTGRLAATEDQQHAGAHV